MRKYVTRKECENDPNLIVPIAFDDLFHEVFGIQKNVANTEALLSALLGIPYDEIKGHVIIKSRGRSNLTVNSKHSEKDIVAWVDINEPLKITIEMNKYSTLQPIIDRNIFFASDVFSSGLERGSSYEDLVQTIQFSFNPRYINNRYNNVIERYTLKNDFNYELTDKFISYQINVARLSELWYNEEERKKCNINPLLILFGALIWENEKDKFEEIIKSELMDKTIGTLIEGIVFDMNKNSDFVVKYFDSDECRRQEIEAERKYLIKKAAEQARAKALAEGLAEGRAQLILTMHKNGLTNEEIHNNCDIELEEIEKVLELSNKVKKSKKNNI